jgi:hypothetical protein
LNADNRKVTKTGKRILHKTLNFYSSLSFVAVCCRAAFALVCTTPFQPSAKHSAQKPHSLGGISPSHEIDPEGTNLDKMKMNTEKPS